MSHDVNEVKEPLSILWRHFLVQKEPELRVILRYTNEKSSESIDLYENGFDRLVEASIDEFRSWVKENEHYISVVFDRNISSVWIDYEQYELKQSSEALQQSFSEKATKASKIQRLENATFEALQTIEISMMNKVLGDQYDGRKNYVRYRQTMADVDKFLLKAWED